jgi:hypothetical protein
LRPPICYICDKKIEDLNKGGLVYFKKRQSDLEWDEKMRKTGMVGHPPYAEWFCEEHFQAARKLQNLTRTQAINILKTQL